MTRYALVPIVLPADPTQPLEAATKQYVDAVSGGGAGNVLAFSFNASTNEPVVGSQVRFNNSTQSAVTLVWISETTFDGMDVMVGLSRLTAGYKLYIQDFDDAAVWLLFDVIGAGTDKGSYWQIPVAWNSQSVSPIPTQKIALQSIIPPSGGGGGLSQATADGLYVNVTGDTITSGALAFGSRFGQHLNMYSTTNGMGVQNGVQYQRVGSSSAYSWFRGGVHADTARDPGAGGTEIMYLDTLGALAPANGLESHRNSGSAGKFIRIYDDEVFAWDAGAVAPLKIQRAGGTTTFLGPVVLASDPSSALGAATKQYVDGKVGGIPVVTRFVTAGSFSWGPAPVGMIYAHVEVFAGGGAGGGCVTTVASQSSMGGGGGGGGYTSAFFNAGALSLSQQVTVGSGGTAVSGAAGGNGVDSSFGTSGTTVSAKGGLGGLSAVVNQGAVGGNHGGVGAIGATAEDIATATGQGGLPGIWTSATVGMSGTGGRGGGPYGGSGAQGRNTSGVGTVGGVFGGGGSGAFNLASQSARLGGNGGPGYVIVTEYY